MSNLDKDRQYDQLNQRSRWYSAQLWYVPFAFVGIIALGIDKASAVPEPMKTFVFLILSFFSLAAFVHVKALKYYERRSVRAMQQLESPVVSGGGSPWYMSFVLYIKIMLAIAVLGFFWGGTSSWPLWVRIIFAFCFALVLVAVWFSDQKRNDALLRDIRAATDQNPSTEPGA